MFKLVLIIDERLIHFQEQLPTFEKDEMHLLEIPLSLQHAHWDGNIQQSYFLG